MNYKNRIVDQSIQSKLDTMGALLIEGPKWCGKTTTGEQFSKSQIYIDDPQFHAQYLTLAQINISQLLQGNTPKLIDEWQMIPQIWDAVRHTVDRRHLPGQFILTGSAVPPDKSKIAHSGIGRFAWTAMRPMTLWESGESSGEVSLGALFDEGNVCQGSASLQLSDIAHLTCRGGWPAALDLTPRQALGIAHEYVNGLIHSDINRVDNVERNPQLTERLLRTYSRHQGAQVSISKIEADINSNISASDKTIISYIEALKALFVIEDMPAWNPNLRSKVAIRTSDTRYFVDPSIGVGSLRIGPNDLIKDLNTLGLFFETMAVRDLRVYAESLDGDVYHYRDGNGLECDAVVHLRNGKYGLVEIKLGGDTLIEEGAKTLASLSAKIDIEKMGAPSFKMVLTAVGPFAYCRQDGICVVPIGCLKN
ncbi:MAG: DUF4143 domain-containing protein [Bacteroidales bacterium]|nr:DUF4143 domain-containing protein [Bacteroidales bacterium]